MLNRLTIRLIIVLVAFLAPAVPAAPPQTKPPPTPAVPRPDADSRIPTGTRGISGWIYVGESAPGFDLENAHGRRIKLASFRGGRVMLIFADRRETISEYRQIADSLLAMGIRLVSVSRDSPRALRGMAERDSLGFDLLSDPTGEVSATYGSYDFATSSIRPGYVLVGRTSLVRMALLGQKLPPDDLLRITRYALIGL